MFSSPMVATPTLPRAHVIGVSVFEAVRDEIAAAVPADSDPRMLAVHFWTALHGIVTLRAARKNFPWPPIDAEIDDLITRLLRTG